MPQPHKSLKRVQTDSMRPNLLPGACIILVAGCDTVSMLIPGRSIAGSMVCPVTGVHVIV